MCEKYIIKLMEKIKSHYGTFTVIDTKLLARNISFKAVSYNGRDILAT
jgi:hypothetical protein